MADLDCVPVDRAQVARTQNVPCSGWFPKAAERWRSPAAGSGSDVGGKIDRERGHGCLFSRSLSKLLVSLSSSSSFPGDDSHLGQVCGPLAPFALQMSSPCHPARGELWRERKRIVMGQW